eukprot:1324596-Prymnesium_polylepis.1
MCVSLTSLERVLEYLHVPTEPVGAARRDATSPLPAPQPLLRMRPSTEPTRLAHDATDPKAHS